MSKGDPIREKAQERLQLVAAGNYDWRLGTVGIEREGEVVARAERLARATMVFAGEALMSLKSLHEPEGSVKVALGLMTEKSYREAAGMSQAGAKRAVKFLEDLEEGDKTRMHSRLRLQGIVDPAGLEKLALEVAVVMLRTRMALEEMVRLEHWHETPTLI